jgi:RNA polymerase sigma-70 factor, ECF subfamily
MESSHFDPEVHLCNLMNTHNDELFRYCMMQLSDRETCLDIISEVWIAFWNYSCKQTIEQPRSLLYQILKRRIIDSIRKKKSLSLDELYENQDFEPCSNDNILDNTVKSDDATLLRAHLCKLPAYEKDILIHRYLEELSLEEISNITGVSTKTLSVQIHRAKEKLALICKQAGISNHYFYDNE